MRFSTALTKLILFLSIGAFVSIGQGTDDEKMAEINTQWSEHFAGKPLPGFFANINKREAWPIRNWIKGYEKCKAPIDHLWSELENYEKLFFAQKYKEAEAVYQKISQAQYSSGDCSQAMWTALLAKSVLLGPKIDIKKQSQKEVTLEKPVESGKSFFEQVGEEPQVSDIKIGADGVIEEINPEDIFTDYRYELSLLVTFFSNKGIFNKLTPALRQVIAGDYPDSIWLRKNEEGYFTVAFFDCFSSKIFLDADLRPFNLAATTYHELDHLFRDKGFTSAHELDHNHPYYQEARTYVALDELLATISSGFYQRRFMEVDRNFTLNVDSIGNEFNLFRIDGPLNASFDLIFEQGKVQPTRFPNPSGFFANLSNLEDWEGDTQAEKLICEMHEAILQGYFENNTDNLCKDETRNVGDYRDLSSLFLDTQLFDLAKMRGLRLHAWEETWDMPNGYLNQIIGFFNGFAGALVSPSHRCEQMMEEQGKGSVDDYLGTLLSSSGGGSGGNGGVRPWLLPSISGASEPGAGILRPSEFGIRPCTRTRF